jgi:hypothetical protein
LDLDPRALGAAEVRAYWRARASGASALLVDGQPALAIRERSALWLFGAEPEMNTLVYKPAFLVLLHRVLALLGESGSVLRVTGGSIVRQPGSGVSGPGGSPAKLDGTGNAWQLGQQGWYRSTAPDRSGLVAVNIPPRESALTALSGAEASLVFRNVPAPHPGSPAARPAPLEYLLLLGVVAALSAEALMRASRT